MWDEPKKKLGIKQSAEATESDMARVEKRAKKKKKKRKETRTQKTMTQEAQEKPANNVCSCEDTIGPNWCGYC